MKFSTVYCIIILVLIQQQSDGFLLNKLRKNIKAFMKGKNSQIREYPSIGGLEYPGNILALQGRIEKLWKEYYTCLKRKYELLGPQKTVTPEAIMVFEGSSIR